MTVHIERVTLAEFIIRFLTLTAKRPSKVLVTGDRMEDARDPLDTIARAIPTWFIDKVVTANGAEEIRLKDGSRILARTRRGPTNPARGYSLDLIIIDELTSHDWMAEAAPAFATTGGAFITLDLESP